VTQLANEAGVARFLCSSCCSSYGQVGDDLVEKTTELRPINAYAILKVWVSETW
jgi:UDP-glucose 4-epimerase